jgi:hypothetical protein
MELFSIRRLKRPRSDFKTSDRVREPRFLAGFRLGFQESKVLNKAQADAKAQSTTQSGGLDGVLKPLRTFFTEILLDINLQPYLKIGDGSESF